MKEHEKRMVRMDNRVIDMLIVLCFVGMDMEYVPLKERRCERNKRDHATIHERYVV